MPSCFASLQERELTGYKAQLALKGEEVAALQTTKVEVEEKLLVQVS